MILGIDPGLSGAFAVYDPEHNSILESMRVPTLTIKRNGKTKAALDLHTLVAAIRRLHVQYHPLNALLELVGAMPGQGVSSMFSFGAVNGAIETAIVAAQIPYSKVTPRVWKKALQCPADKDGALLRANQLMPASATHWTSIRLERDKQDCIGIAEAALIAYYGAKILA